MPNSPPACQGCLEQRFSGPNNVATYFSTRSCAPAHTDPNVISAYCVTPDVMKQLGQYCYPISADTWHCL